MRAEVDVRPVRERRLARARDRALRRPLWRRAVAWSAAFVLLLALACGVLLAGSADRIAGGVTVGGVDVEGMSANEAAGFLERRAEEYASVPRIFTAAGARWALSPQDLHVRADWAAAADEARAAGSWPLPFRGLKRLAVRIFGSDVEPTVGVDGRRLRRALARIAADVDRPARDAAIVLDGLRPVVVPGRDGRRLDREATREAIVRALAGFDRRLVPLPVDLERPSVTASELAPVADDVRTALSGPVRFGWRDVHWLVQPSQLARLLALPAEGSSELRIGGPEADRYFSPIARAVDREPKNARFAVTSTGGVRVVASVRGRSLAAAASAEALLAAALSADARDAELVVRTIAPKLTTGRARAMKVTRVLAAYTTAYAGTADRVHNLQLAVSLLDGTRLAPGETFSLNQIVGPRTEERGFRSAPVIVDGEYAEGIGGGVSQVATTVFNAAWEAGLKISARAQHALYISRYPAGRDATVNYPDLDLRFVNDTGSWLVVRGTAGDTGITISLLGAPTRRRVVSEAGPLEETGPPEVERVPDPRLYVGERVIIDEGEPPRAITVKRTVYDGDEVLYAETWYTRYRSEPRIVHVGTKPRPGARPPSGKKKPEGGKSGVTGKPKSENPTGTAPPPGTTAPSG